MSHDSVTIRDEQYGSTARIAVGRGFNCYSFQAIANGQPLELLWSVDGFAAGEGSPSGSGIPILFPFPGRIRDGRMTFHGRTFQIERGDGRGNAIHGFVLDRRWQIVEQHANRVVGRFHAADGDPEILRQWPADFVLTVTYEIRGNRLDSRFVVVNPGTPPLPCGLGMHPYFRVPLGGHGNAGDCRITVPAEMYWELDDLLPTGIRRSASGARRLSPGKPFAETVLDDVLSNLMFTNGYCTASVHDALSGRTLSIGFDPQFRECVVYTPPHREAICIEPYTCVPDSFTLAEQGIDTGMRVLGRGESFTAQVRVWLD